MRSRTPSRITRSGLRKGIACSNIFRRCSQLKTRTLKAKIWSFGAICSLDSSVVSPAPARIKGRMRFRRMSSVDCWLCSVSYQSTLKGGDCRWMDMTLSRMLAAMSSDRKKVLPDFALPATATSSLRGKQGTSKILNKNSIGGRWLSSVIRCLNRVFSSGEVQECCPARSSCPRMGSFIYTVLYGFIRFLNFRKFHGA